MTSINFEANLPEVLNSEQLIMERGSNPDILGDYKQGYEDLPCSLLLQCQEL